MNIKIDADVRTKGTKSELNQLRKNGYIPAIIYGDGLQGTLITLEKVSFMKQYKQTLGEMAFFDIKLKGQNYKTIIKEKQVHPVTRDIRHIDFMELHKGKKILVEVPFKFVGEPIGVKEGGILEVLLRRIEISCLPKDIPEDFEVDISNLKLDHSLHLNDLDIGDYDTRYPLDTTIITVKSRRGIKSEDEEESEEETEIES